MKDERFEDIVTKLSCHNNVKCVLLVGSRATETNSCQSDYDLHIIVENIEIQDLILHFRGDLQIDMTIYEYSKIDKLSQDRKMEFKEATVLYTDGLRLPVSEDFVEFPNIKHWIRFHLKHIQEDFKKENNITLQTLHKLRYLYHSVEYKENLEDRYFRGYKRLNWNLEDNNKFQTCIENLENDNFFQFVDDFIGKEKLKSLDFAPLFVDIESKTPISKVINNSFYQDIIKLIGL